MADDTEIKIKIKTFVHPDEKLRIKLAIRKLLELKFVPEVIEIEGERR